MIEFLNLDKGVTIGTLKKFCEGLDDSTMIFWYNANSDEKLDCRTTSVYLEKDYWDFDKSYQINLNIFIEKKDEDCHFELIY